MRIGFTYDLRRDYLALGYGEEETAEFDKPETIDAIDAAIRATGHETDRIGNIRALVSRLHRGDRWELVFNIAEGLRGLGREAQVPALLDAYEIPYTFSDPVVLALTLHKGLTKHIVRGHGVPTPDFAVVESPDEVASVDLSYPLFVKPVAEGTSKGVSPASIVRDSTALEQQCEHLLATFGQPVLVERYLPGREVTVGIVGSGRRAHALGVMEVLFNDKADAGAYSYLNKELYLERVTYALVEGSTAEEAERLALTAWRCLGCRDAGRVDLRADESGRLQFLETNPLPGLNPDHSDLPIMCRLLAKPYGELIREIVEEACRRLPASEARA